MDKDACKKRLFPWCPLSQGRRPTGDELSQFGDQGSIRENPYAYIVGETHLTACCSNCFLQCQKHMKRCGACRMIHYCSHRCQARDWKRVHRVECRMLIGCDPEWPAAKVDDYIRLVIRVIIRSRNDKDVQGVSRKWFYSMPARCLREIPARKSVYFSHAHNRERYQTFREGIRHLGDYKALLDDEAQSWTNENELQGSFCAVSTTAFPVLSFLPWNRGCEQVGLGLYLNFAAFTHEWYPDLALNFQPSENGPVISGRLVKGESSAKPLHSLTITRAEVPYDCFGTNLLTKEEVCQYISLAYGIESDMKAALIEDLYYGSLLSKKCPSCAESEHVIAGICSCGLPDKLGTDQCGAASNESPGSGTTSSNCWVCCQFSKIPRSERAFCLNPQCSMTVFRYQPRFGWPAVDPVGLLALKQALRRDMLGIANGKEDPVSAALRLEGSNILVARVCEFERWTETYWILLKLANNINNIEIPRSFIEFAEAHIASVYAGYLPESSYARIAWLWRMAETIDGLFSVQQLDDKRSFLRDLLMDKSKRFKELIADAIELRVGKNTAMGEKMMQRLRRLRVDFENKMNSLGMGFWTSQKVDWQEMGGILGKPF